MGNRANIEIKNTNGQSVFLYTHWGGIEECRNALFRALKSAPRRWDDEAYLARIIFCRLVQGQELEETGYGIATYPPDEEGGQRLIINPRQGTIEDMQRGQESFDSWLENNKVNSYS